MIYSLDETIKKHGYPKNNHCLVCVDCSKCLEVTDIRLGSLKRYFRKSKSEKYTCFECINHDNFSATQEEISLYRDPDNQNNIICQTCLKSYPMTNMSLGQKIRKKKKLGGPIECYSCSMKNDSFVNEMKIINKRISNKLWSDPEYRKRTLQRLHSDSSKSKRMKSIASFLSSGKDTIIERVTQQILDQLGVPFERQKVIGPYSFDLFIPSHNLLIECQGEYWHSLSQHKKRDVAKFTYIDKYFPDYRILYLYERDFLNPGIVKQKLIRELFDPDFSEKNVNFSFSDVKIKELSVKDKLPNSHYSSPEEFLQSYHYAGFGRYAKKIFGAYLGNKLIAVCKFASVVRKEVAISLSLLCKQVAELDRFCIHPQYQKKNFASWFISRCIKLISDPKVTCLVSFADSTFGHSGTIYKAANWTEIGKVKPSYHYISQDGWVLHKKTLYNHARSMKKSECEYAEENKYQKVWGKEKIKFIYNIKDHA